MIWIIGKYIFLVFLKNTKVRETVKCYQLRHLPAKVDLSRLSCVFLYLLLNVYEMKFNGFLLFSFDKFFARDFFKTIFSLSASTQKKLNHEFIYSRLRYKSANKFLSLHIENILNIILTKRWNYTKNAFWICKHFYRFQQTNKFCPVHIF